MKDPDHIDDTKSGDEPTKWDNVAATGRVMERMRRFGFISPTVPKGHELREGRDANVRVVRSDGTPEDDWQEVAKLVPTFTNLDRIVKAPDGTWDEIHHMTYGAPVLVYAAKQDSVNNDGTVVYLTKIIPGADFATWQRERGGKRSAARTR